MIIAHLSGPEAVGTFHILMQLSAFALGFVIMFTTPTWPSVVDAYARDLRALAEKLVALETTNVFWLAAPRVRDDALTDPAKRTYMTDEIVRSYGEAARHVPGFLYRDDTTNETNAKVAFAAVPVDVGALAAGCGAAVAGDAGAFCSSDGVHASRAVYDAAAQVIANVVVAHAEASGRHV